MVLRVKGSTGKRGRLWTPVFREKGLSGQKKKKA